MQTKVWIASATAVTVIACSTAAHATGGEHTRDGTHGPQATAAASAGSSLALDAKPSTDPDARATTTSPPDRRAGAGAPGRHPSK
jgi:hypothetical protein